MAELIDREAFRNRLDLARLMVDASRPISSVAAVAVVLGAMLPAAFSIATGVAISSAGEAVNGRQGAAGARRMLIGALAVVGVVFVVQQVMAPARDAVLDMLGRRVRRNVFARTMAANLRPSSIAHLEDPTLRDQVAKATSAGQIGPRMAVRGLAGMWSLRLAGLSSLAILVTYRWWLSALLLLALVFQLRRTRAIHRGLVSARYRQIGTLRRSDYLRDMLLLPEAAKEVRVFGLGDWFAGRFLAEWRSAIDEVWARRRSSWRSLLIGAVPATAVEAAILLLATGDALDGRLSVGRLVVYVQAVFASTAVSSISDNDTHIEQGCAVIRATLDLESMTAADPTLYLEGSHPVEDAPLVEICFEDVSFRYPGQDHDTLSRLSLTIRHGERLAIVGDNGAGKTTIIKLLARLYDPTGGRITVDGVDLRYLDPGQWQRRIAAIFQDFVRYPLSAAANVGFGAVESQGDLDALAWAAEHAGALGLIESLASGWDTTLTREFDGGTDLSGGEWQRIAIARALFAARCGAGVLVLDEPTAHLDVQQEAAFYDNFLGATSGLTAIVVSHRFSTVRRADRVVVLHGGAVVEDGSHRELIGRGGRYARMFQLQARSFQDGHVA